MIFYRKFGQRNYLFVLGGIFTILLISIPGSASASSKSPYDSGYDHGCDDARISNPSQQYINQPEKGPSFHTSEFMNGYYVGLNSCGSNTGGSYYQEPQQQRSNQGFKETLNQCKEDFSSAQGLSDTIDTVIGGACIVAGGLSELTK